MTSLLDPSYGFVWLEDDLPVSVAVKDGLQQRLIGAIMKEAEAKIYLLRFYDPRITALFVHHW